MGDRALVVFTDGKELSPVTYLHWNGQEVPKLLEETRELMRSRGDDLAYTAARFVGVCHKFVDGNLSLGMWNAPENVDKLKEESYSHGDAGVFLVNVDTWEAEAFNGYGFYGHDDPNNGGEPKMKVTFK